MHLCGVTMIHETKGVTVATCVHEFFYSDYPNFTEYSVALYCYTMMSRTALFKLRSVESISERNSSQLGSDNDIAIITVNHYYIFFLL